MGKVIVVGAGTMGAGIAQVTAQAGYRVVLTDVSDKLVRRGLETIENNLKRAVDKGKITAELKAELLAGVRGVAHVEETPDELAGADLVIEAIVESMEPKKSLFRGLDPLCPAETVFASNTSALSITELAASTGRADKFIGLHFFNPVPVMQLVEIIAGAATSSETLGFCTEFVEKIGKVSVKVAEAPGFVVNRMVVPMINEAAFILMEGVASPEDIDAAMRMGLNHPIGPLALGDMIGLDVCLSIMETLSHEFDDSKYRPSPLLRKMVRAGYLGRKTGQGFYKY
jgi:3-hydroxybutyryl-CoA dehydrogenase